MVQYPTASQLQARLQEVLQPQWVEVIDESALHHGHAGANGSGSGTHFRVRIRAAAFAGLSRVAQHRLVYDALSGWLQQGLHALAIEAQAPAAQHDRPSS
ncbi:MAG: BolA family transcriptional regulator [Rhodoferax sp.]